MPIPPEVLDAPPAVPMRRSGLFTVAPPMAMPEHVQTSGAQWWSDVCGQTRLYPPACLDVAYAPFLLDASGGLEDAYPYLVYASTICPPVGVPADESARRVRARLLASEQKRAERAFWGGDGAGKLGVLERLGAGVTLLAGTAANVTAAVSALEQAAADSLYDGPLIIHARAGVAAYAGAAGLVRDRLEGDGEHQYTHFGSEWSFGAGYAGTSPDNATPPDGTTEYMVITGRVFVWRTAEPWVSPPDQMLDKTTNQRGMIAVRPYALGVDCFAAAVKFTRA